MVSIPGGCVDMDNSASGQEHDAEDQPKQVCVQEFALGKYEVTQAQWQAVMGSNPSAFAGCDDCPVERVSWNDAQDYIRKLNAKTGKHYRLPSNAEWEIACRADGRHEYCGADEIEAVAWYYGNADHHTQPVGGKQSNARGLHDMSGNVWEWTQDCEEDCAMRMLRGGSWGNVERGVRAAFRNREVATTRSEFVGLRLAR
ncbi:MAG: formylglycine-generating enzyme family protein [Pseudomonadota bacterium]